MRAGWMAGGAGCLEHVCGFSETDTRTEPNTDDGEEELDQVDGMGSHLLE